MEKKSLISCRLGKSPLGPKRKYYTVTESGKKYYEEFKRIFKEIIAKTNEIISADNL